jgi:hypothetical protein
VTDDQPIISRREAKARGLIRYFTGKPCKFGHVAERHVASWGCMICSSTRNLAWHHAHPEVIKARRQARLDADREYRKAYYQAHKAEKARYQKEHRAANLDRLRIRDAAYYQANKDRCRATMRAANKANPERLKTSVHNHRARRKGIPGSHTTADIKRIRMQQKDRCAYCRSKLHGGGHRDHIVPTIKGGTNWAANIQLTCDTCNFRKHAKDPLAFAREFGKLL